MPEVKATDPVSRWIKLVSWVHDRWCLVDFRLANYLAHRDPRWQETDEDRAERERWRPHLTVDDLAGAAYLYLRRVVPGEPRMNHRTRELADWCLVDYDEDGYPIGVEILGTATDGYPTLVMMPTSKKE